MFSVLISCYKFLAETDSRLAMDQQLITEATHLMIKSVVGAGGECRGITSVLGKNVKYVMYEYAISECKCNIVKLSNLRKFTGARWSYS